MSGCPLSLRLARVPSTIAWPGPGAQHPRCPPSRHGTAVFRRPRLPESRRPPPLPLLAPPGSSSGRFCRSERLLAIAGLARGRRPRPIHRVATAAASDGGYRDGHGRGCGRAAALPQRRCQLSAPAAGSAEIVTGTVKVGQRLTVAVPEARRVQWCAVELQTDKIGSPAKARPPFPTGPAAVTVRDAVRPFRVPSQLGVGAAATWRRCSLICNVQLLPLNERSFN